MDEISTITQSVLNCLDVLKRNRSCSTSGDINIKSNVTNAVTGILLWPPLALSTHKKTFSIGLGSLGCLLCSLTFDALRQPAVEQLLVKHYLARKKTFDCNRIEKTALHRFESIKLIHCALIHSIPLVSGVSRHCYKFCDSIFGHHLSAAWAH